MKHLLHKLNSLRLLTLLTLLLGVGTRQGWADEVFYTLTPATGTNNSYTSSCDVTIDGITWNITGNSQMTPWRIGGKSLSNVDRTVYSKTQMGAAITKIELTVGAASSITVHSLKLIVASDADFSTVIDQVSAKFAANSTITFTPTSQGSEWAKDAYYKFVFNVTVSGSSNKFVEFSGAKWYYTPPTTPVTGVSLSKTATTLEVGDTETLTATISPDNADNKNVTWSSSAPSVARVNNDGVITAVEPGTATITVTTVDGSYTATCTVTVNASTKAFVNMTGFTATSTTIIKGATTTTTVTNDQPNWSAEYTYTSSDASVATVNASGVITAVAKGTATITCSLNVGQSDANYKTGTTSSMTVDITVCNPSHTATFSSNGSTFATPVTVEEGEAITFPTDAPADVNGYSFVGWAEAPITGTTDAAPTFVTSATMGENDVTYYAVFAKVKKGNFTTVIDELTKATTDATGNSYTDWSDKTVTSSAVYAGNSAGGNESIQLRSDKSPSGIITTASGGKATKVEVVWNSNTADERTLTIYGKRTAFSSPADLYSNGTSNGNTLGDITNGTTELALTGDYQYIGIRSKSGTLYLTSISITWANGTPDTYSNYCTTVSTLPVPVITMSDVTMDAGETGKSVVPTATINEEAYTGTFTYNVDGDDLTVGTDGSLTSSTPGTYTVTASIAGTDTYQAASATCTVVVRQQPTMPTTSNEAVAYGETYTLSLDGTDCGDVSLTSANEAVATVDGLTVTPVAVGSTTITVHADADETHAAGTTSFTLTVTQPSPNTTVAGNFVHVTSTNDVTDGKYLIVYNGLAFDGSLETLDAVGNSKSVEAQMGDITNTAETSAASFTITRVDGGYTIKSASGYYIGQTSNANGLATSKETPYVNTISINDDSGEADIVSGDAHLRYNKDSGQERFRYFKSSTYTGQKAVQLYKAGTTGSESVTLNSAGYLAYASANPMDFSATRGFSAWQITAIEGSTITFERITTAIAGGQGVLLKGEAGATISIPLKESTTQLASNKLAATLAPTYFDDETMYGLSGDKFYLNSPCTLKANRAYIPASEVEAQGQAKSFIFVFHDPTTGITETQTTTGAASTAIYNLAGQRLAKPRRGINIVGGKKVMVMPTR